MSIVEGFLITRYTTSNTKNSLYDHQHKCKNIEHHVYDLHVYGLNRCDREVPDRHWPVVWMEQSEKEANKVS